MNTTEIIGKKIAVQKISEEASSWNYEVSKDSNLTLLVLIFGRKKTVAEVSVRLTGRGAEATIIGLVLGKGKTITSLHTHQLHQAPETISNLLVKSVLKDSATFSYDGSIRVEQAAQKTNAYQRNENLLLSPHAHAKSEPSLEILANDVRCTHGATAGPIPPEQLWYLGTRGISPGVGKRLIVDGFVRGMLTVLDSQTNRHVAVWLARALRLWYKE